MATFREARDALMFAYQDGSIDDTEFAQCRFGDMVARFGRPVPQLSIITNRIMDYVFDEYSHLLAHLNQPWLSRNSLRHFAAAIHDEEAPLENCWSFIDGPVRPSCKPDQNQRILYNGHKGCMA